MQRYFVTQEFTCIKLFDIIGILPQGHLDDKDFEKAESLIGG